MDYIPPIGGGADDSYIDGDMASGVVGSVPSAAAIEAPMREIVNAISALGGEPDDGDLGQLGALIAQALAEASGRTGDIIIHYGSTPAIGSLELDGTLLSRTTYSALWAEAQARGLVTTDAEWLAGQSGLFSDGDGAATFRLPDWRGEFLRGWDHGRNINAGRQLGSLELGSIAAHDHMQYFNFPPATNVYSQGWGYSTNNSQTKYDPALRTGVTGGDETRPRNVAVMFCVKY